jgi:hypothetical protein
MSERTTINIEYLDQDMTRGDLIEVLDQLRFVGCESTATLRIDRGVTAYLLHLLRERRR